jgi:hypothetical protein
MYWYLDSTPTHSYMKFLYKYPQSAFPYEQIKEENQNRSRDVTEFELMDTDVFDEDRYWDIFVEVSFFGLAIIELIGSTPRMKRMRMPCRSESRHTTEVPMLPICTSCPRCTSETPGHGPKNARMSPLSDKNPRVSLRLPTRLSARPGYTVLLRLHLLHLPRVVLF